MNVNEKYFNNSCRMTTFKNQQGMSLISVLVGIGISAFLLLMIAQLSSIAKQNYVQTQNIIGLYDNAREAIQFLNTNVAMAGYGILQPRSQTENTPLSSTQPTQSGPGGYAVLPDWVYIGYYDENSSTRQFPNQIESSKVTPQSCANIINGSPGTFAFVQFFGLQWCNQCWTLSTPAAAPPAAGFASSNLAWTSQSTSSSTCCTNTTSGTSCPGSCASPGYNCGGSLQNAVYQRLMRHVCFVNESFSVNNCAWQNITLPASSGFSGNALTIVFSNPGSNPTSSSGSSGASMTSFSGSAIPVSPTQPTNSFNYYSFYVENNTLQAIDSLSSTSTAYNIANNVEFMAVMVGESDFIAGYGDSNGKAYALPQINRYVLPVAPVVPTGSGSVGASSGSLSAATNLYPYRVLAVRVGIVVRTQDPIQSVPTTGTPNPINVMLANNGSWIQYTPAANDGRLRKAFVTTIYLNSYTLPDYQAHCAGAGSGTGNYYTFPATSGNYYLKTGGTPFTTTWTTNDQCNGGNTYTNCSTMTWSACETLRMQGGG